MAVPHSIALAAATLDVSVVKAWVESGGDVNGLFDPDARDHGGRDGCHPDLRDLDGGESLLLLVVGIHSVDEMRSVDDERDTLPTN